MSKKPFRAPKYTIDELIAITDEWECWSEFKDKRNIHVRLIDTMDALHMLTPPLAEAVFLIGFAQLTTREASKLAGVPFVTLWRRYQRGLENMAHYLNGESYKP